MIAEIYGVVLCKAEERIRNFFLRPSSSQPTFHERAELIKQIGLTSEICIFDRDFAEIGTQQVSPSESPLNYVA